MTRRRISPSERVAIFKRAHGCCYLCEEKIGLAERWDVEHRVPLEMGGDETKGSDNLQPAHVSCHRSKTSVDSWALAKAKRREAKHLGARGTPAFRHPTLKRTVDGRIVPR